MTEVLTTCSIMTNCALVGFVSHGILFYFPDISPNQRVTKLSPALFTTHTLSPASLYIRNLEGGGSTVLGASRPPPPSSLSPYPLVAFTAHGTGIRLCQMLIECGTASALSSSARLCLPFFLCELCRLRGSRALAGIRLCRMCRPSPVCRLRGSTASAISFS